MKNIIVFTLILASTWMLFSCRESEEERSKRELDIQFLTLTGRSYLGKDMLEDAEETYLQLIKKAPDEATAYANLALVYLKQNRYEEAEKRIKQALKKAPDNLDIRMISARYFELTQQPEKAIGEFGKILEKDPDYVEALYNLALIYNQPENESANSNREKYLKMVVEKAPGNIVPKIDLIDLFMKKDRYEEATMHLEELPKIFPEFPAEPAVYYEKTMAALYASDTATAGSNFILFRNFISVTGQYQSGLKGLKGPDGTFTGLLVLTLSDFDLPYAREGESIYNRIRFFDTSVKMGLISASEQDQDKAGVEEVASQFTLGDFDGDDYVDVYVSAQGSRRLLRNRNGVYFEDKTGQVDSPAGLETAAKFGDYDNDGYIDLYVVKDGSNELFKNDKNGGFTNVTPNSKTDDRASGSAALFLDADHDGDLDLLVVRPASNLLYRNNGDGSFSEKATEMGLGRPLTNCTDAAFADFDDDGDLDLFFTNDKTSGLLFTNERHGKFTNVTSASGLQNSKPAVAVAAADYNNDGFTDLLLLSKTPGNLELFNNRGDGTFKAVPTPWVKALKNLEALDAMFFDFDNDAFLDIMVVGRPLRSGSRGAFLFHNDGRGNFEDVSNLLPASLVSARQIGTADFDKDGDLDVFAANLKGDFQILENEGGSMNHYLRLKLMARRDGSGKNNHFGIGAKVELRSRELYQTKVVTEPNMHFGLGSHLKADVVRILWTNGVAQYLYFPGTDQELLEAEALKGSCAFLYTWDGEKYVFFKDMMWRSALGMPLGIMGANTAYAPSDPSQEYLKIPGEMMKPQGGKYIIQVTEELWETAYFDNLELVAIDHPAAEEVFVDEKFTLPPYSNEYELFAVQKKFSPVSATDGAGTDVLPLILKKDDRYISNFQLDEYQGVTETHDLVLDPGKDLPPDDVVLFMNGWIFPSDASINVALGQSSKLKVIPPQLQVINKKGEWQTVIPNMGFPMGKDKLMIVDLSGKFLSKDRRVRIRTNMQIYWDEIFFAPKAKPSQVRASRLKPTGADLHYRGFSALYRKGGRYGPHWFDYSKVEKDPKWRDLIGRYTRFGEVVSLLTEVDDKLVIMNSGDEMTVSFDASALPPLPAGWKRDFLIYSEGWIKDGDLNTAHGKTVDPLPFHAMTRYPYGKEEAFPSDTEHLEYLKKYNTREVNTKNFRREVFDIK